MEEAEAEPTMEGQQMDDPYVIYMATSTPRTEV
jgi:hypothetical protein